MENSDHTPKKKSGFLKAGLFFVLLSVVLFLAVRKPYLFGKGLVKSGKGFDKMTGNVFKKEAVKFSREKILANLRTKIKNGEPLVVHALVPLCDNDNQGIVRVNKSLGDGKNLTTNLYWGSAYGVKSYFRKYTDWKFLAGSKPADESILERVVFVKKFPNGVRVCFIADAYSGDKMTECLQAYLKSLSGDYSDSLIIEGKKILIGNGADLMVFNGHDGLMDMMMDELPLKEGRDPRDAAIIACQSYAYFMDHLAISGGYPLLTTTGNLAPEAYVMAAVLNSWAMLEDPAVTRNKAGDAYHLFQKCGQKAGRGLFKTGW
jgi:hypothetical protein